MLCCFVVWKARHTFRRQTRRRESGIIANAFYHLFAKSSLFSEVDGCELLWGQEGTQGIQIKEWWCFPFTEKWINICSFKEAMREWFGFHTCCEYPLFNGFPWSRNARLVDWALSHCLYLYFVKWWDKKRGRICWSLSQWWYPIAHSPLSQISLLSQITF